MNFINFTNIITAVNLPQEKIELHRCDELHNSIEIEERDAFNHGDGFYQDDKFHYLIKHSHMIILSGK